MAGRPAKIDLDRCPRCDGGMYTMDSSTRHKQQCVRCGFSPQDRPEHAEPKQYKPLRKPQKRPPSDAR